MTTAFSLTDLGLASSATQLLQTWLATMQTAFPGYSPNRGNQEYIQALIFSSFSADNAQLCSIGSLELFRVFGTTILNVPYEQGTPAVATVTVTAQAAPSTIATLSGPLSTGAAILSLPVVALQYGVAPGTITVVDPTNAHSQTWTTAGALAGATVVPVSSDTPNYAYPTGSTISGAQSYVVPAFSQFTLDNLGFQNPATVTLTSGTSANVSLVAVIPGTAFNGAGAGGAVQIVQQTNWVSLLTIAAVASDGVDPEDDTHYLNRLVTQTQLMALRPITATDFANVALNWIPAPFTDQQEVGRATAVDGYDPNTMTYNNEREVTVCVTDSSGNALNNDTMYGIGGTPSSIVTTPGTWGIAGWFKSLREMNFITNVIAPTYTTIYVTVTVLPSVGQSTANVQANVQAALLAYLSPQNWGLPLSSVTGWQNSPIIYQSAINAVVQGAPGVASIVPGTLRFDTSASPSNTGDLTIAGPVALPESTVASIPLSAITVT